jgi:hypothetical protein
MKIAFRRNRIMGNCVQREMKAVFVPSAVAAPPVPVGQSGAWTHVIGLASDGTSLAGTYAACAGVDRMMLIALAAEFANPVSMVGTAIIHAGAALKTALSNKK